MGEVLGDGTGREKLGGGGGGGGGRLAPAPGVGGDPQARAQLGRQRRTEAAAHGSAQDLAQPFDAVPSLRDT